jgi:predicted RNA binding protein YcfA (HicA-like mRNA interferase family)
MGAGIPVLAAAEVERILLRLGFSSRSAKGAHRFYRHTDGRTTTLPFHSGRDISPVLLRKVCRDIGVTVEVFIGHR